MFTTYTINLTTWTAIPRADLDPSVSSTSRVYHDGGGEYAKVKLLPITGGVPEDAVYQVSTSRCDATGKALLGAQGQVILTSPRRLSCSTVNEGASLDAQLDAEVEKELRQYVMLTASLDVQTHVMENWAA